MSLKNILGSGIKPASLSTEESQLLTKTIRQKVRHKYQFSNWVDEKYFSIAPAKSSGISSASKTNHDTMDGVSAALQ